MTSLLLAFGWVYIIVALLVIAIPFSRRRSDLLTSFNVFVFGSIDFIGIASIRAATSPGLGMRYYEDSDIPKFLLGAIVFFIALLVGYFWLKRAPRAVAGRVLLKWPPDTDRALKLLLVPMWVLSLGSVFVPNIEFVGQNISVLGVMSLYMLGTLAMVLWLRNRWSVPRLILLVVITAYVGLFSLVSVSRRQLVCLLMVFFLVPYWLHLRYLPSRRYIWKLLAIGAVCFVIVSGYNMIRYRRGSGQGLDSAVQSLEMLPAQFMNFGGQQAQTMADGDAAVECSLAAIHWYTYDAETHPFFTLEFILANPIPRAWWPDKPESLGATLPAAVGQVEHYGYVNWGPGIVGHCYQEGGVFFAVFYGILFGIGLRFADELLVRQADNPFLLGIFCACSANVFALSRGDTGVFLSIIIFMAMYGIIAMTVARLCLGSGLVYPSDKQRAEMQFYGSQFSPDSGASIEPAAR